MPITTRTRVVSARYAEHSGSSSLKTTWIQTVGLEPPISDTHGECSDSSLSDVDEEILRAGPPSPIASHPAKRLKLTATVHVKRAKRQAGLSSHAFPSLSSPNFGLIQESIAHNLYFLVVQAILWNQTHGRQARPVFRELVARYPDPCALASASLAELTALLQPLGLHNIRAKRCILLGKTWIECPPESGRAYKRKGYPHKEAVTYATAMSALSSSSPATVTVTVVDVVGEGENAWEIAHLPGVGPYALDSFRIFHRDEMRGLAKDWLGSGAAEGFEPEWKRVLPLDKELKAYLKWMWLKEGWEWDWTTGRRTPVGEVVEQERVEAGQL